VKREQGAGPGGGRTSQQWNGNNPPGWELSANSDTGITRMDTSLRRRDWTQGERPPLCADGTEHRERERTTLRRGNTHLRRERTMRRGFSTLGERGLCAEVSLSGYIGRHIHRYTPYTCCMGGIYTCYTPWGIPGDTPTNTPWGIPRCWKAPESLSSLVRSLL